MSDYTIKTGWFSNSVFEGHPASDKQPPAFKSYGPKMGAIMKCLGLGFEATVGGTLQVVDKSTFIEWKEKRIVTASSSKEIHKTAVKLLKEELKRYAKEIKEDSGIMTLDHFDQIIFNYKEKKLERAQSEKDVAIADKFRELRVKSKAAPLELENN